MENKKNDWLATLLFNPEKTIDDFRALDITPDNTGLLSIEEYKNNPKVQEFFINEQTGKFDESRFTDFYNNAKISYNYYADNEWTKDAVSKYEYGEDVWFAPLDAGIRKEAPRFIINNKPSPISQGISFLPEMSNSDSDLSIRELAQREKAVNYETGEEFDWSPNEKGGFIKSLSRPTLVLAQYDDDGTHFENGIEVQHHKGDLKLNKNNKPYYETLGKRDIYGKDVLHYTDTITVEGTTLNKFDFLDADSKEKGLGSTLIRTAIQIAPMFIPGAGYIYGAITAAGALSRVIPIIAKGVDSIFTGNDDDPFGRKMSEWEAWSEANLNWNTVSDKGREQFMSAEALGNLISAISGQLFQQKLIGTLPAILNKGGSWVKNAKVGKDLALGYMAVTSAQDTYSEFKQAGASDRVAGLGMLGSMIGLYALMNQEYFRDNLFRYSYMDESGIRMPALGFAKEFDEKTLKALGQSVDKKQAAGFVNKVKDIYKNKFLHAISSNEFISRSWAEATEEVMEEIVTDLIKATNLGLDALGVQMTENKEDDLDFGWTGQDFLQRYAMNALGGFIGGGIFHLQGKYDTWYNQHFKHQLKNDIAKDDFKRLVYYIANGDADAIRGYYTKWWRQGRLGNTNLTVDSDVLSFLDENKVVQQVAKRGDYTQNDMVYAGLMNIISELEQAIKSECGKLLSEEELNKIAARGFDPANMKMITAHSMVELGSYSKFANDFYTTLANIISTKSNLDAMIADLNTKNNDATESAKKQTAENIANNPEIIRLREHLKELEDEKNAFLNGEKNKYYAGQSIFFINNALHKMFLDISNVEDYSLLKHGVTYNSLPDYKKKELDAEFSNYQNLEGSDKIAYAYDLYLNFSQIWGPSLQKAQKLLKNVKPNDVHEENLEFENYRELLKEFNDLTGQIEKLDPKKEDEVEKIVELRVKRDEVNAKISAMEKNNPAFILQLSLNNKKYGDLRESFLQLVTDKSLLNMLTSLREIYSNGANTYFENDDQLNAFFSIIGKQYLKINPYARLDDFIANLIYTEYDGDYEAAFSLNKNNDNFISNPGDITKFQKELISEIIDVVSSLGYDNKIFIKKLENIKQILKTRTNLNDIQIDDFVKWMFPKIGNLSILDIINEFDAYKSNIIYDPFLETLGEVLRITIGEQDYSLLDLFNLETKNLANVDDITTYTIQSNLRPAFDLDKLKSYAKMLGGIVGGAWDGTNGIINSFKGGEIENLSEIDDSVYSILNRQMAMFFGKMDILRELSDSNAAASLRVHQDIELNMRPKLIQKLIDPAFAKKFDELFKKSVDIDTPEDDTPFLIKKFKELFSDGLDFANIDERKYKEIQSSLIQLEDIVTETIQNKNLSISELAKNIRILVGGDSANALYKLGTSQMSKKKEEEISEYDFGIYLTSLAVLPSSTFYSHTKSMLNGNKLDIASVYGQEYDARLALSYTLNTALFNSVLDEFVIPERMDLSKVNEESKKWYQNRKTLHNFLMISGGAGTGKTMGFAKFFIQSLINENNVNDVDVIAIAPNKDQVKKLGDSLGITDSSKKFTKDGFQNALIGKVLGDYTIDENTLLVKSNTEWNNSNFKSVMNNAAKIKIAVIDEITLFTNSELELISTWAENNGVLILGLGDPKQNSAKISIGKNYVNAGIEDCYYLKTPELTGSLRISNEAKRINEIVLGTQLRSINSEWDKNPHWGIRDLDSKVDSKIPLVYYESEDKSILYGEKLIKEDSQIFDYIDRFKDKGAVMIVTDNISKYNVKYGGIDNIKIVDANDAQGGESNYVIIDKDFAVSNTIGGSLSKYSTLRDLYTLSQRSTTATIIFDKGLTDAIKISDNLSNPIYNQIVQPADENRKEIFKKWKLETLENVNYEDNLYTLLSKVDNKKDFIKSGKTSPILPKIDIPNDLESEEDDSSSLEDEELPVLPGGSPVTPADFGTLKYNLKPQHTGKVQKVVVSGISLWNHLNSSDFIKYDGDKLIGKEGNTSLAQFIHDLSGTGKTVSGDKFLTYKKYINGIAGWVKANKPLSKNYAKNLAEFIINGGSRNAELLNLLQSIPDLYFIEYGSNVKLIAKYTGIINGKEYSFDIPISIITQNKPSLGKFDGIFELPKRKDGRYVKPKLIPVNLDEGETLLTLEEFKQRNPFVEFNSTWAILATDLDSINTNIFNDTTKLLLGIPPKNTEQFKNISLARRQNNMGKAFTGITDSPAIAEDCFGNKMYYPKDGWSITEYGKYGFVGLQKVGNAKEIFKYVKSFNNIISNKNPEEDTEKWFTWTDAKKDVKYLSGQDISNISFRERRNYQIIPEKSLPYLTNAIFEVASNSSDIERHINIGLFKYLVSTNKTSKKSRGERHTLKLINGKNVAYVDPVLENNTFKGEFVITTYIDGKSNVVHYNTNLTTFKMQNLFKTAFGNDATIGGIEFKTIVLAEKDEDNESTVNVVPNKVLYYLLSDLKENDLDILSEGVQKNSHFVNNVYLQMYGDETSTAFGGKSPYRPYVGNDTNVRIGIKDYVPQNYIINVSVQSSKTKPSEELYVNGKRAFKTYQELINYLDNIPDNPKLQEVLKREKQAGKVINDWLLAWSGDYNKVRQIKQDLETGLFYEDIISVSPEKWLRQNYAWKFNEEFDLNEKLKTTLTFGNGVDGFVSDIKNLNYGLFFVSLSDNTYSRFIRKTDDGYEYTNYSLNGGNFQTLVEKLKDGKYPATLAYMNILPFDYNSKYDQIIQNAYKELQDPNANQLYEEICMYLKNRLRDDEC